MERVNRFSFYFFLMISTPTIAADMQNSQSLMKDCYQEWQSRGWTLGEDQQPAESIAGFCDGIVKHEQNYFCREKTFLPTYRDGFEIWLHTFSLQAKKI